MIHLIATLKIKPGSLEDIRAHAMPCIAATRLEPGCISYDLHQSLSEPDTLVFVERWKDRPALDAHFGMPHLVEWRDNGAPFILERRIEIIEDGMIEVR
ncbi:MAG: antibiotic biosynthesis monooxygenase [Nitratireductor sp.]|nr:antibiotic biosynthesis monooxygenase [Nitratireductor sp.]MCC0022484.1 antibiotic biosynthesis monooxygenase [Nitratireductor sp.]